MNYELCKQLKDAGFPQEGKGHFELDVANRRALTDRYSTPEAYVPTLSELIEACGDCVGIFKISETECNAWSNKLENVTKVDGMIFTGSTPEEAVARLWLALNSAEIKEGKDV